MSDFYIHRKLHSGDEVISDSELLKKSGVFVVLAEPGAGKTDLLTYFSQALGVPREPASLFVHSAPSAKSVLIIDSLDEVARISEEKIDEIIFKARASGAGKVILASRSYVWDEARTRLVHDCFGNAPTIVRLEPFDEDEQRELFTHHLPNENFVTFVAEVNRFELGAILGNPQFLKLLADAYLEGGRHFVSKRQIYTDALSRLASESAKTGGVRDRPPTNIIVAVAGEVFAKLLLSGASGISTQENIGDDDFPYLRSVGQNDLVLNFTLNTRLFKPTLSVNRHEPIHRLVAEFCAAEYLVRRIEDSTNTFSIKRCLAILAPNGVVRSELRGLLGWMASLGGLSTQEAVISADPYAVFANGDPSQLLPSSKRKLLDGLTSLAQADPFFRQMDSWRRFSVAGFFSEDVTEHVRALLTPQHAGSDLRGLVLELLHKTVAAVGLQQDLRAILHDPQATVSERHQAFQNLEAIEGYDIIADFDILATQASVGALKIVSEMVIDNGSHCFGAARLLQLLEALAQLYQTEYKRGRAIGSRYFIRQLIAAIGLNDAINLLNEITDRIICICGKAKDYQCTCRIGRSKVAGLLLDRYFDAMVGPHDPRQIHRWTKPLVFKRNLSGEQSASVRCLNSCEGLRRAIQDNYFDGLTTQQEIQDARIRLSFGNGHSGLMLQAGDVRVIVDYAMATGNHALWEYFIPFHDPYTERNRPHELRAHMRRQASQSLDLLKIWARVERGGRQQRRSDFIRFSPSRKRRAHEEERQKEDQLEHFRQNRAQIEAGRNWGWLQFFAQQYLHADEIEDIVKEPQTTEKALLNCFDFLAPHVPTLEQVSETPNTSIMMVLEAACLITFRQNGTLKGISRRILEAIKANGVSGSVYKEGEVERLEAELDDLLFSSDTDVINYATRYIEPQLIRPDDSPPRLYFFDKGDAFRNVKGALSLKWLQRYPNMPRGMRDVLFNIAARFADRRELNALIETRCNDPFDSSDIGKKRRKFWLLRHFFFVFPTSELLWCELTANPKSIFAIEHYSGRFSRDDHIGWPQLNSEQIYHVLDMFVSSWPKVDLPSSYGTSDPEEEIAYRYLSNTIFQIRRDETQRAIVVLDRILSDARFVEFHRTIKSEKAAVLRQLALTGFQAPRPAEISKLLDESKIASVEDMRAVLIELLDEYQIRLKGAATDPVEVFYSGGARVNENTGRNRIVEFLEARLNALNLGVVVEHQMSNSTRCDFTASTSINGFQATLVTELKGQWHPELYTAAATQLAERYTIYPGAAEQGVYLVLWFGNEEVIAGKKESSITTAAELHQSIVSHMPESLKGRINVYVLDVSRPLGEKAIGNPKNKGDKEKSVSPSRTRSKKKTS